METNLPGVLAILGLGGLWAFSDIYTDIRDWQRERAGRRRAATAETDRWWRAQHPWE